jgi:glycosyltransferase involved in cell wall biosynthesis
MPVKPPAKTAHMVLVSSYFPPVVGGTSTVLRNLVSQLNPKKVSIVTEYRDLPADAPRTQVPQGLKIYKTSIAAAIFKKIPYIWRWERFFRFALIFRVRDLTLRAIKESGAEFILGIYPNWPFLIGAYLAHRASGIPFLTYHMDIPVRRSAMAAFEGFFIEAYEEKILHAAKKRLIISAGYAQDFTHRFGLDSTLLPHSIDLGKIHQRMAKLPRPPDDGSTRIVHTGIVEGQKEGLLRIAETLHKNPDLDARLILSSPTPRDRLLNQGFDLPCVEILTLPHDKVLDLQASAHILVTVLPFFHKTKEGALTGYPTKLVEYFATGRPILIHAPAWTHLCQHARRHGYASIVDEACENSIADAIRKLRQDNDHRRAISQKATEQANNFDIQKVTRQFLQMIPTS